MFENLKWKREYRLVWDATDDDHNEHIEVVVSREDDGTWTWQATDFMAWRSEEANGVGNEPTLEAAQEKALAWLKTDRFGIEAIVF